ncbi:cell surface glycoprotein CD200 receptor 1-A isoform X2 [Myripristis murdjan]|uniref:cell surface glycoprotein CD200 receptor 1-A isoform X2 n=1 Tax=Myripristis murdjan TaxID=586833 RepID=UPI001176424A|nr:cell surface glycoprotein CD200 receptor 1 isoform X2 [Myripristis murdjan]
MWFKIRFRFTFNVFLSGMSGTLSGKFSEELEMREMVWVYGVIILFIASEAWSLDSVSKDVIFNIGTDVNLTCSNKTWDEMMFTIWKIKLTSGCCEIGFNTPGQSDNTCQKGKALYNTSMGESYLFIPSISNSDEGVYRCESVYIGGLNAVKFNVSVRVPPKLSAWLEWQGNRRVAVCSAEGGKPKASIVWMNIGNSSAVPVEETKKDPDGFYSVTSRLVLPEGMDTGNLTCAVSHSSWAVGRTVTPQPRAVTHFSWVPLLIPVIIVVFLLGFVYFTRKNLMLIRHCCQSNTPPSESKSPPTEDVEEVEPYASYTQRVNSLYNSSADLFT